MSRLVRRLCILAAAVVALWIAAFLYLAIFADGCGLEFVLPWFDSQHSACR